VTAAETSEYDRLPRQMGEAQSDFTFRSLRQPMYVGSDEVSAIAFQLRLVPTKERM
jgi:hypothetical protein